MSDKQETIDKSDKDSDEFYYVVENIEGQYSIWPVYKPVPPGWKTIGEPGRKTQCLEYIKKVWTDLRPLSLRRQMGD